MNLSRRLLTGTKTFFQLLGFTIWGFLFLALAILLPGSQLYTWNQFRTSNDWQSVTGTITRSQVSHDEGAYSPDIMYKFDVRGKEYIGTNVHFGADFDFLSDSDAKSSVAKYPVGAKVTVYYDPESPFLVFDSVLERVYKPNWISLAVWGMVAVGAGVSGFSFLARAVVIAKRIIEAIRIC